MSELNTIIYAAASKLKAVHAYPVNEKSILTIIDKTIQQSIQYFISWANTNFLVLVSDHDPSNSGLQDGIIDLKAMHEHFFLKSHPSPDRIPDDFPQDYYAMQFLIEGLFSEIKDLKKENYKLMAKLSEAREKGY